MPSVQVPDEDGDRRVQEGLEEGGVEIDDGEDPVKWIDDDSDDFKDLIQCLPTFADNYCAVFSQHVVEYLDNFEEAILLNYLLDGVELVGDIVVFGGVDEPQSADVRLQL